MAIACRGQALDRLVAFAFPIGMSYMTIPIALYFRRRLGIEPKLLFNLFSAFILVAAPPI